MKNEYKCQCIVCKHARKEVSDDYYQGFMEALSITIKPFIDTLKQLGFEATGLSDEKSIGQYISYLEDTVLATDELLIEFLKTKDVV